MSKRFFDNFLTNLPAILAGSDVAILANAFHGENVPAIVAGAGPSLDKQLPILHDNSKKAVIVATDAALIPLLKADILPDFVVTTDPTESTFRYLDAGERRPVLIYEGGCNPAVVSLFDRRLSMFSWGAVSAPITRKMHPGYVSEVAGWGSVLNMAVGVCDLMGFANVILIGADYAYTGGQFYCGNFNGAPAPQLIIPITGPDGNVTHSNLLFVSYAKWLESQLPNYQSKVINSTEGGILSLPNTIPFKFAVKKYCRREFAVNFSWPADQNINQSERIAPWKEATLADLDRLEAVLAAGSGDQVECDPLTLAVVRHLSVENFNNGGFLESIAWLRGRLSCLN